MVDGKERWEPFPRVWRWREKQHQPREGERGGRRFFFLHSHPKSWTRDDTWPTIQPTNQPPSTTTWGRGESSLPYFEVAERCPIAHRADEDLLQELTWKIPSSSSSKLFFYGSSSSSSSLSSPSSSPSFFFKEAAVIHGLEMGDGDWNFLLPPHITLFFWKKKEKNGGHWRERGGSSLEAPS